MATLNKTTNGNTHRICSIVMSAFSALPFMLGCVYLLITIENNLNEDAQVLFFFFGLPLFMGCSFIATMLIYNRLYRQSWPQGIYRTSGLLAFVISIPLEWFLIYITSRFSLSNNLVLWIIIMGAWLLMLLITWMFFALILHRRYHVKFTW